MKYQIIFDKYSDCKKCNGTVAHLKKFKSWHHLKQSDYLRCGFVELPHNEESIGENRRVL